MEGGSGGGKLHAAGTADFILSIYTCLLCVTIFAKPTERVNQRERICSNRQCSLALERERERERERESE